SLLPPHLAAHLVGTDKLPVFINLWPAETPLEDDDRCEHHARTDFHKGKLRLALVGLLCSSGGGCSGFCICTILSLPLIPRLRLDNLVAPPPDLPICDREADNIINEGLWFSRSLGYAEDVRKHFPQEPPVRGAVESCVEGEERAGTL